MITFLTVLSFLWVTIVGLGFAADIKDQMNGKRVEPVEPWVFISGLVALAFLISRSFGAF